MAKYRHFADLANGQTVEIKSNIFSKRIGGKDVRFGIDPANPPVWNGKEWTGYVQVTRSIKYTTYYVKHECDARCYNAQGTTMNCECQCGGANHGKGPVEKRMICEAA